jgi:hypothetical protein
MSLSAAVEESPRLSKLTVDVLPTATGYRITVPGLLFEEGVTPGHCRASVGRLKAVELLLATIDALQGTSHLTGPVDADTTISRS